MTDVDLARASAAAVHGRVVAIESSWDADAIYTHVTLDVLQAWGLAGSPARVVVKQLGGVVDDVALLIGGQARFESGEEVFLFLDVRPRDGRCRWPDSSRASGRCPRRPPRRRR